jgi:hypothetical protein
MPNEGVGRVAPHGNQKQSRQALLAARQERRRQSSPESRTRPLPKLISVKELEEIRHDVPPVSYLRAQIITISNSISLSQLVPAATVSSRAAVLVAPSKAGASNATLARTRNTVGVRSKNHPKNGWIMRRLLLRQGKTR